MDFLLCMKLISLTKGQITYVDDEDYALLMKHSWAFNGRYAMRSAWTGKGYKTIYMHREILKPQKGFFTDHVNGDGLLNVRRNLRVCTRRLNQHNSRKPNRYSKSVFKGVGKHNQTSWKARIY